MNLEYIEDLIDRENINLIDTYLEDVDGAYVNYDKINAILYNCKVLNSSSKKKEILAEELGHYYGSYTYKFTSNLDLINKQEYRAKKYAYNMLIPYEKLKLAILKRI